MSHETPEGGGTVPSQRARELVRGAYDTHIHIEPDVMKRRIDDLSLARRCLDVGLAGFVLKSHYAPTAERAALARRAVPGVDVRGAITLNASVGGMNPVAVEIAARSGATVVWLPTVDSANQRASHARDPEGARPPMWAALQAELRERGIAADPVPVTGPDGRVTSELRQVLDLVAEHGMVLATGHLSDQEIMTVVAAAREAGVERIVVTHPEFTSQRVPADAQRELAERGALLERCFTTPHTGKVSWDEVFAHIRAAGPESSVISSDLGQPFNPPVEDGIALMADRLLAAGFSDKDITVMTVRNTRWLMGAEDAA
jgi:sugar phosphate isomerase/epimerase